MCRPSRRQNAAIASLVEDSPLSASSESSPGSPTVALVFLCACIALFMTGFGIIIPVFPNRLQALGLGAETLAWMEGVFGLGMFLLSTPMGIAAAHIGRKPIVLFCLFGFFLTNTILALATSPLFFVLIRFVEGACVSGLIPAASAIVGDRIAPEKQGRWIGMITTAQAIGVALGPALGGVLVNAWGSTSPFFLSAGITLLAFLLALLLVPETLLKQTRAYKKDKQLVRILEIFRLISLFTSFIFIDVILSCIYPFVLPQYPFFFEKSLHYGAIQYGSIVSIYSVSVSFFPLLLGSASNFMSKKRVIVLGSILYTTMNVAMLFFHQYVLLILAAFVTGGGNALLLPTLGTLYLEATTERNRSQVMGLRGSAISLGTLIGSFAQALVGDWITPQTTFAIGTFLSIIIAIFAFLALPKAPIRTNKQEDTL